MSVSQGQPIACCLGASDYRMRIAWIEDLTRRALQRHVRDDLTLRLFYAPAASAEVERLVALERVCCPFLRFDLAEEDGALRLTVSAPEAARGSEDTLFGQYLGQPAPG